MTDTVKPIERVTVLTGRTSPETAYVVDDYPYGGLRCTKLTKLTALQSDALTSLLPDEIEAGTVTVTASTVLFAMSGAEALSLVHKARTAVGEKRSRRGHPYQSLHAVVIKLSEAAK